MYCDEPGEPCNVNVVYNKDPLEGKVVWQYDSNIDANVKIEDQVLLQID
jgi:hypothetical protein